MTINPPGPVKRTGTLESGYTYTLTDSHITIHDPDGEQVYEAYYGDLKSINQAGRTVTLRHDERGKADFIAATREDAYAIAQTIRVNRAGKRSTWKTNQTFFIVVGAIVLGILGLLGVSAVLAWTGWADNGDSGGSARCLNVSGAKLNDIEQGLEPGLSLRNGQAVRSDDYEQVYMIAADIQGPGLEGSDDVGVWSSNSLRANQGLVFAVDAVAREFTNWGRLPNSSSTDHGVREAKRCVD